MACGFDALLLGAGDDPLRVDGGPPDDGSNPADPASDARDASAEPWARPLRQLGAGASQSYALRSSRLAVWGSNGSGELGVGDGPNALQPTFVGSTTWSQLAAGDAFGCAVEAGTARLACWGDNARGQLGLGDRQTRRVPTFVEMDGRVARVEAGGSTACAILDIGSLACWGEGRDGQLGDAPSNAGYAPRPVAIGAARDWTDIAVGASHVCGLRKGGALYCWGRADEGQLGVTPPPPARVTSPTRVGPPDTFTLVSSGGDSTCALTESGGLWCWGSNDSGQLGLASTAKRAALPVRVEEGTTWKTVSMGKQSACAIDSATTLWCWGNNGRGQLGLGDRDQRRSPAPVLLPTAPSAVAAGASHACVTDADGNTWCTGRNDTGALGLSDTVDRLLFTRQSP